MNANKAHKSINSLFYALERDFLIMYGCLVLVCWDLSNNYKLQCNGCCVPPDKQNFALSVFVDNELRHPHQHPVVQWNRVPKKWQGDIWKMTTELIGILVSVRSVFLAAETLHYMRNEPQFFCQFPLLFFSRQKSCKTTANIFCLSWGTKTTQKDTFSRRLFISSFACLCFYTLWKRYKYVKVLIFLLIAKCKYRWPLSTAMGSVLSWV